MPRKLLMTLALVALGFGLSRDARASTIWVEVGDAGGLPGTANMTVGSGPLTHITGTVSTSTDADMYLIFISSPASFSATTVGTTLATATGRTLPLR